MKHECDVTRRSRLALTAILLSFLVPAAAMAQSDDLTGFIVRGIDGDASMADALAQCARSFSMPLENSGLYVERGDTELDALGEICFEDTLFNPMAQHECAVARARSEADYVIGFRVQQRADGLLVEASAFEVAQAGSVWSQDYLAGSGDIVLRARDACQIMGQAFVDQVSDYVPMGQIAVFDVSPSGAEVYIDGELLGSAGRAYDVGAGMRHVRLWVEGYEEYMQWVSVTEGETSALPVVDLTEARRTLLVRADVDGAIIRMEGSVVGYTVAGQDVEVSVSAAARGFAIELDGYETAHERIPTSSGDTVRVDVQMRERAGLPPDQPMRTISYATMGVGLLSIGAGVLFYLDSSEQQNIMIAAQGVDAVAFAAAREAGQSSSDLSVVFYTAGAVLIGTGGFLWFISEPDEPDDRRAHLEFGFGSVFVVGRF